MATFSVVVVNYNGSLVLERCIRSILASSEQPLLAEVIVVDNASGDEVVERVSSISPLVRLLRLSKNIGYGGAVNKGVEQAKGSHFVALNNDAEVPIGWLALFDRVFERSPHRQIACATIVYDSRPHEVQSAGTFLSALGMAGALWKGRIASELPDESQVAAPTGACMAASVASFQGLGGFDESLFMYCEDLDLGWRASAQGMAIVSLGGLLVRHRTGDNRPESPTYYSHQIRNRLLVIRKNGTGLRDALVLGASVATAVAAGAVLALRRRARIGTTLAAVGAGLTREVSRTPPSRTSSYRMPLLSPADSLGTLMAQFGTHAKRRES